MVADRISDIQSNFDNNLLSKLSENNDEIMNPYDSINISCNYKNFEQTLQHLKDNEGLRILSWNIHSLKKKFNDFKDFLNCFHADKCSFDIIAITECWKIIDSDVFHLDGYNFFHKSRKGEGGGIAFFINKRFKYKEISRLSIFEEKVFESICIELEINKKTKILISNVYRSNGRHPIYSEAEQCDRFLDLFSNLQEQMSLFKGDSYIVGDLNFDLLKFQQHERTKDLLENSFSNGFLELISLPTRLTHNTATLIDHVYTNSIRDNFDTSIIISDISDHFPILTILPDKKKISKSPFIEIRNFSEEKLQLFKEDFFMIDWNELYEENDAQTAYDYFHEKFDYSFNKHFPLKKVKFNKNFHAKEPFMTRGLLKSRLKKLKLVDDKIREPTDENINRYKEYRNVYNKLIRAAKQLYYKSALEMHKHDLKKSWEILRDAIRKKKDKTSLIEEIRDNNVHISDDVGMAESFNHHFTNIANNITNSINPSDRDCTEYIQENNFHFDFGNVYSVEIKNIVKEMKSKTSSDMFGVSNNFVKQTVDVLLDPLTHIFNLSLTTGKIPTSLKKAKVIPIYKLSQRDAESKSNMSNYRPISLLPIFSKILEKLVAIRLTIFLKNNDILYKHQYGFQARKSTVHPIVHFLNKISEASNEKLISIGVFCDLQKAFDCCSHRILLQKMKKLGIKDNELLWFENYLKNRQQFVHVNQGKSSFKYISKGVPQGSILGPLLFLIYINDLACCTTLFTLLFADDTSFLISGKNLPEVIDQLNSELHKICYWFRTNELSLHPQKTKFMIFTKNNAIINHEEININLNYNNYDENRQDLIHKLTSSSTIKFLGVTIDPKLDFKQHIESIHSKISKSLFAINAAKNILSKEVLLMLYKSLVHCHLLYCIQTYTSASVSTLKKLVVQQKKAIRIVTGSRFNSHTVPIFKHHEILPLFEEGKFSKILFMHDYIHGRLPCSFDGLWIRNYQRGENDRELRNANFFDIPYIRLESFMSFPIAEIPRLWNNIVITNNLNENVRRNFFSKTIKKFLLDNLHFVCQKDNCQECQ